MDFTVVPVSYTHLDVYKRQVKDFQHNLYDIILLNGFNYLETVSTQMKYLKGMKVENKSTRLKINN